MIFARDENKNHINRRKQGIAFETAARVFEDPGAVSYVEQVIEGEERWHTIGNAGGIVLLLVAPAAKEGNGEEEIRIISARKAGPRERALYHSPA